MLSYLWFAFETHLLLKLSIVIRNYYKTLILDHLA